MHISGMRHSLLTVLLAAMPMSASPASPVTPVDVVPAAYSQSEAVVASNGHGFMAVWLDERMAEHPNFSGHPAIFATRIHDDGHSLDPFGIEIALDAYSPHIASNGNGYLVSYDDRQGLHVLHLGDDGRPDTSPRLIGSGSTTVELTSNGSTYCLLRSVYPSTAAMILDEQGAILREIGIAGLAAAAVPTDDGGYVAISVRHDCSAPCKASLVSTTIAADGGLTEHPVASLDVELGRFRAVSSGSRILLSWIDRFAKEGVQYLILRPDGTPVGPVHQIDGAIAADNGRDGLSVAFDGRSFLIAWQPFGFDGGARALRVDENGEPRDPQPIDLPATGTFRAARHDANVMLVSWDEGRENADVVSRTVSSFDALPDLAPGSVIAFSSTTQSEPDSATSGKVVMTVAREGDSSGVIGATLFAAGAEAVGAHRVLAPAIPFTLQDGPSVGVAGDIFLAVWRERGDQSTRILGKRVAANGEVLDLEPLVIAQEPVSYAVFADTAVTSDGDTFFVVWHSAAEEIRAIRVRRDGTLIQPAITVSRHPGEPMRMRRTPAVIWLSSTYLVVWNEFIVPEGNVSQQNPTHVVYRAARVARDGTVLDATESAVLFERPGLGQGLALARSPERVLLATATGSYIGTPWSIDALLFDLEGNPLSATPVLLAEAEYSSMLMNPAAAWNGRSFLVFWSDRATDARIRGAAVDPHGLVVSRFDASTETSYYPTAVSVDGGALLVHTGIASDQANVARLLARTFTPEPPRRRPVRH